MARGVLLFVGGVVMNEVWRIAIEVTIAAFAVLGFYSALKMLADAMFPTEQIGVALRLYEEKQAANLDLLLQSATCSKIRHRQGRIVVLISASLMRGCMGYGEVLRPEVEDTLRRYDADCFVVDLTREV